jgi:hypothetical protein
MRDPLGIVGMYEIDGSAVRAQHWLDNGGGPPSLPLPQFALFTGYRLNTVRLPQLLLSEKKHVARILLFV